MRNKEKLDVIESQLLASIRGKVLAINARQERIDAIREQLENIHYNEELQEQLEFSTFLRDTYLTELNGLREATTVVLNIIYNYESGKALDIIYKEEEKLTDDITTLFKNS